ncbi:GntR family transcriptional regulator [Caballeronia arationis]|jgi:DNA-binding GntR family transcriptional regulator|uniref:Transcriptional regulator, GntR family n=1 Tax=Caballeronia arationis TaxID=1777142 RepID=A0A7Z7IAQ0_9BURK|nr:GntR family transcriptional regulator [Caballeronia arationis]SAK55139.1 GntR family transcriptional regulator [Caballeronia arationis]SOE81136.1 transcriptional regulator, GntR family [Caballeronia arationis]
MASRKRPSTDDLPIDERIHAALTKALLEGKLAPGAQLVERDLAAAFDCTRGTIRKVLMRLGYEGKVVLEANRGAFVPSPSEDDIRAVYRARQVIEAGIVVTLCGALTTQQKRSLRAHVKSEARALKSGNVEDCVRLAGQFHLLLVEMAAAPELHAFFAQLVAKTELYKALFDPSKASNCASDDHERLIDALETGHFDAALASMREHLAELEERVVARANERAGADLVTLFSGA